MDKANKAFRRSGIRLRSVKSGHTSLRLIASDCKESRKAYKSFISNQETLWSDIIKWVTSEPNKAHKEVLGHIMQLQALWTDAQSHFSITLKKFQYQFKKILESELKLDKSRSVLASCEEKGAKLDKELSKACTKSCVDDLKEIEKRKGNVNISIQEAKMEVAYNAAETESVKMLCLKEGLINLSNQFIELADKTSLIFKALRTVASTLPDAQINVHEFKFSGGETCVTAVAQVKEKLRNYTDPSKQPSGPPLPTSISNMTYPYLHFENRTYEMRYCNYPPREETSFPNQSSKPS